MSDLHEIAEWVRLACEKVVMEKESLITHFLLQHPEVKPENIRFCQQQVYDDLGNPYFKYWIELKRGVKID